MARPARTRALSGYTYACGGAVASDRQVTAVARADLLLRQVGADEQRLLSEAEMIRSGLAVRRPDSRPI